MPNLSIPYIEWLAEQNKTSVHDGDRVIVCDFQGNEIAHGTLVYTGASGWRAYAQVNGREFQTWLILPKETVWLDLEGRFVYLYHADAEPPLEINLTRREIAEIQDLIG